jgi:hypothetical protein
MRTVIPLLLQRQLGAGASIVCYRVLLVHTGIYRNHTITFIVLDVCQETRWSRLQTPSTKTIILSREREHFSQAHNPPLTDEITLRYAYLQF